MNSRASFSQLDGTTHHGVDNGEETNRPPKPPFPEGPDGLEETEDQEPETDESDVQCDTTEKFQDKDKEEEEEEEEEESKPGDESDMSDYGSQRWRCDVCQTWKQYKGEEHPFNCSLCMNKMELYFGFFKC